ncbi:hypothetical protein CCY01nite_37840 [Chitinophaga cymbidii]|uniref:Uncharacterized protein n=1 Tax=Chitinophaga cymbidii TaxID=1096750 RepID=A0A512RPB4_9BACT|nr:hypothetical protein CCY01nite_37840 [Chitinophaga cymbidii]
MRIDEAIIDHEMDDDYLFCHAAKSIMSDNGATLQGYTVFVKRSGNLRRSLSMRKHWNWN